MTPFAAMRLRNAAGGGAPTYFNDFSNPATLSDFTPYQSDGSGTVTWAITGGQMIASGGSSVQAENVCDAGPTLADGYVEGTFNEANQSGLVWRVQSGSQFYLLVIGDNSSTIIGATVYVYYRNGGSYSTVLGGAPIPGGWVRGTPKTFRYAMTGSAWGVSIDGASLSYGTDTSLASAGKAGVYAYGTGANAINDFAIG